MAVSKGQPSSAIEQVYASGIQHFGESYWQEAQEKISALQALPIVWHFIGPLQSNKAKSIAAHFDWVHSVDRLKTAYLLSQHRSVTQVPLQICVQVNFSKQRHKSGADPTQALHLIQQIETLAHLHVRGLMCIPSPEPNHDEPYASFLQLRNLMHELNKKTQKPLDTLSMGMSADFPSAIRAGATILRIGKAIFDAV